MTKKEAVVIEAYTGVCMLTGDDRNLFYKYINQLIGRPVYTHELPALRNEIKEKAKPDFIKICKNMDKKIKNRKFKAMTNSEFCKTYAGEENFDCSECSMYRYTSVCELVEYWNLISKKPYKTKDGKYIFVEVKE